MDDRYQTVKDFIAAIGGEGYVAPEKDEVVPIEDEEVTVNAEDIPDPLDTATTADGLSEVLRKAVLTWPALSVRSNITNFSGVRAHLTVDDFVIGPCDGVPGYFEAIGIESPGLSSAPAIGSELSVMIARNA